MTKNVQEKLVDWHKIWKNTMENCNLLGREAGTLKQWSANEAEQFLKDSDEQYVKKIMERIEVTSDDNVLDIGCGPGRLTIPFAKIANSVTAVDTAKGMLKVLNRRAKEEKLDNIVCVNNFWREVKVGKDTKQEYDVVIASNSVNLLGAKEVKKDNRTQLDWNLVETLQKIDAVGKHCYMTMPVIAHKNLSEIYATLDKKHCPFPNYIVVHNVLHQMSIKPEIEYFWTQHRKHNNPEKILKRIEWTCNVKADQKEMLKEKIRCNIDKSDKGLQLWALIHWSKN